MGLFLQVVASLIVDDAPFLLGSQYALEVLWIIVEIACLLHVSDFGPCMPQEVLAANFLIQFLQASVNLREQMLGIDAHQGEALGLMEGLFSFFKVANVLVLHCQIVKSDAQSLIECLLVGLWNVEVVLGQGIQFHQRFSFLLIFYIFDSDHLHSLLEVLNS